MGKITNLMGLTMLILSSLFKIIHQVNSFGGMTQDENREVISGGWIWDVKNETMGMICELIDKIWMIFALIFPLCQSGYVAWKKFDTHGLIVTIEDNRIAKLT